MACFTTAHNHISHDGRESGYIIPETGIRQGDLPSSYLFIICTVGFSALIREYKRRGLIKGIRVARGVPSVNHIFFADDNYIFCQARSGEAFHVVNLTTFEKASGHKINLDKSSVFFY